MPLTSRRARIALASGVLAAGLAAASCVPVAASPRVEDPSTTAPASARAVTPGSGPLSVSIAMPITVPPTTTGVIDAETLERYTEPFGLLTRQLDGVIDTPTAIGVDPMILASIRVLGSAAPASAAAWLSRLEAAPNEVFTLAYADADLAAAARTGTLDALVPSGFGFALDPADFAAAVPPEQEPEPDPGPTGTADPDPGAPPPFPSTDDLLAWSSTLPAIAWPAGGVVGGSEVAPLAEAGYTDVMVSSTVTDGRSGPLLDLDGMRGIVVDAELSVMLQDAADAATEGERITALDALGSAFSAEQRAAPGRAVVLAFDRAWPFSPSGVREVLAGLAGDAVQLVPLGEVLATGSAGGKLAASAEAPDRDATLAALADDADAERRFSSALTEPSQLLDPRRLERIALYANGWASDDTGWGAAVAASRERSAQILDSVRIERGSDVVLLASNTPFRVAVSNALPYPITVRVRVDPQGPILHVRESAELVVEPESTGTATLPVEAVANGQVVVATSVESLTGVPLDSGSTRVTVEAEWENIGTLLVVGLLVVVFGVGIVRLVVIRRRGRAGAAADAASGDPDA